MKRFVIIYCATTLALMLQASHALDLTPHPTTLQGNEGPPTPAIQFTDGDKKILWVPPHNWLAEGGGNKLTLTAPGADGAWAKLIVVAKQNPPPAVLDPSAKPEDLQDWAKQYIPAGSKDVTFSKMVESAFMVCTKPSTEFIFTFARYGSRDSISISAVDFSPTELLVVIFSAGPKDFDQARQAVIASMFSMRVLK